MGLSVLGLLRPYQFELSLIHLTISSHMKAQELPLILLTSLAFVLGGCSGETEPASDDTSSPNIVFILADDMGYGDSEAYNAESKIPTPHINRLADGGMVFTDAHAPGSVCVPSRYGLLTGRHPHRVQTQDWRDRPLIEANQLTLGRLLGNRGYSTYMVGKWHLGFKGGNDYDCSQPLRGGPVDRGFDRYFGIPASLDQPPYFYIRNDECVSAPTDTTEGRQSESQIWNEIQAEFWRGGDMAPDFRHEDVLPRLTTESVSYLKSHQKRRAQEPFFMYLALAAPHTPWLPTDSLRGVSEAGLYGDFVAQVDQTVGRVLDALDQLGMSENTIVVFSSDNGPVWYPKDVKKFEHRSTHQYKGMKGDAWEAGHRVPFIARWPGHIPDGTSSSQLLSLTDMSATFADLTGPALPEDSTDGVNLQPILTAEQETIDRGGMVMQSIEYLAVRDGPWKLIPGLGSGGFSWSPTPNKKQPSSGEPEGQLYHLEKDPEEENNLYAENPEIVKQLLDRVRQYRQQMP